jgi:hypothetical protein
MDGLVDTHIYKEVAEAKYKINQNPIYFLWLLRYMRGVEDNQDLVGIQS